MWTQKKFVDHANRKHEVTGVLFIVICFFAGYLIVF